MLDNLLDKVIKELVEYSGKDFAIKYNYNLYCPAMSSLPPWTGERMIEINPNLIPSNQNIIAHIMAHEWGHQILDHVLDDPQSISKDELLIREDEADVYASVFIDFYKYEKTDIIDFLLKTSPDYKNRIIILDNKI